VIRCARQHEQQIGEAIDVPHQYRVHCRFDSHYAPLRPSADGASDMQGGARRAAASQDEPPQRRQVGLVPIDQLFEPSNIVVSKRSLGDTGSERVPRIGQLRAERKEVFLESNEVAGDFVVGARRARQAQAGVQLVDVSVRPHAGLALADSCAVEERRVAGVARACVNLHGQTKLYEMAPRSQRLKPARSVQSHRVARSPKRHRADKPPSLPAPAERRRFRQRLLTWYRRHGRDLPWRKTDDPYHILVSEIMLQQTQVDRVLPKYAEWLEKYPSFDSLAAAPESDVTATWYPLGYNIRPKRLQSIAREAVARYGGQLPADEETLLSFKGIGAYTAGAIQSFAFGKRAAILDTNVSRVLFRVFVATGDPKSHAMKRRLWAVSAALVPVRHVFDFNQALMDFGAMVCVARKPKCLVCPMSGSCRAFPLDPA
jgi:A/G-specific adenine glycosylase